MKAYIGPYRSYLGPYQITEVLKHLGVKKKARRRLAELLKRTIGPMLEYIHSKMKRKVSVRIDPYDTWDADATISHIALPLLLRLKKEKSGSPCVDNEDVPEELRSEGDLYEIDDNFHKRWEYVLDEMIFAHHHLIEGSDTDEYYALPIKERLRLDKRAQRGFELFGKYYYGLWT